MAEGFDEPYSMLLEGGLRVGQESEVRPSNLDALKKNVLDPPVNEIASIHLAVEAILEPILVLEADSQETILVAKVLPHHAIRPLRKGSLQDYGRRGDREPEAVERGGGVASREQIEGCVD